MFGESVGNPKWNLLESKTGTADINIPTNFNELLVIVTLYNTTVNIPIIIPRNVLTNSQQSFRSGYFIGDNSYCTVIVMCALSKLNLAQVNNTGADLTNNSSIKVYYR